MFEHSWVSIPTGVHSPRKPVEQRTRLQGEPLLLELPTWALVSANQVSHCLMYARVWPKQVRAVWELPRRCQLKAWGQNVSLGLPRVPFWSLPPREWSLSIRTRCAYTSPHLPLPPPKSSGLLFQWKACLYSIGVLSWGENTDGSVNWLRFTNNMFQLPGTSPQSQNVPKELPSIRDLGWYGVFWNHYNT